MTDESIKSEKSLREIQLEIETWAVDQFGKDNRSSFVEDPACNTPMGSLIQLCGAITEIAGEMLKPTIEMHQGRWRKGLEPGIRYATYMDEMKDGAADLLIWLCHWAALNDIDLQAELNKVWEERVSKRRKDTWEQDKANETS